MAAGSQQQQHEAEEEDEWLVSCRCESAKAVSTLLSCLRHAATDASSSEREQASSSTYSRSNRSKMASIQPVTVFCSPNTLTFHAHGNMSSKHLQASVDMPAGLFSQFRVAQPEGKDDVQDWQAGGEFCINLSTVHECLHVLGTQNNTLDKTSLCFSYNVTKELFKLELLQQDSGVLMTAAIPGMVTPEHEANGGSLAHAFRSSPNAARIIVKSEILRELVQELETASGAANATVVLGNKGGLEMAACGSWGEVLISIPAKGSHVVSWEPPTTANPPIRTYSLKSLLGSMRGLEVAEETCITVNNNGMMAIQHQVINREVGDGSPCFIDIILCCLENMDDDDDENEAQPQDDDEDASRFPTTTQSVASKYTNASQSYNRPSGSTVASHMSRASSSRRSLATSTEQHPSDSETDDAESHMLSSSAAPLFGSLVDESSSTSLKHSNHSSENRSTSYSRKAQKVSARKKGHKAKNKDKDDDDDDDASNGSRNLMASSSSEDESSEEECSQPLDVTAMVSTPERRRRTEDDSACSSPELVYGRQN